MTKQILTIAALGFFAFCLTLASLFIGKPVQDFYSKPHVDLGFPFPYWRINFDIANDFPSAHAPEYMIKKYDVTSSWEKSVTSSYSKMFLSASFYFLILYLLYRYSHKLRSRKTRPRN